MGMTTEEIQSKGSTITPAATSDTQPNLDAKVSVWKERLTQILQLVAWFNHSPQVPDALKAEVHADSLAKAAKHLEEAINGATPAPTPTPEPEAKVETTAIDTTTTPSAGCCGGCGEPVK